MVAVAILPRLERLSPAAAVAAELHAPIGSIALPILDRRRLIRLARLALLAPLERERAAGMAVAAGIAPSAPARIFRRATAAVVVPEGQRPRPRLVVVERVCQVLAEMRLAGQQERLAQTVELLVVRGSVLPRKQIWAAVLEAVPQRLAQEA